MDRRASSPQLARSLRSETGVVSAESGAGRTIATAHGARGSNPLPIENQFWVEMRPLVVATIQRLPQRTIESIRPIPGTVSPCAARQAPLGPSSTTVPPTTRPSWTPTAPSGPADVRGPASGPAAAPPLAGPPARRGAGVVVGQGFLGARGGGDGGPGRALPPGVGPAGGGGGALGARARH